MVGFLFPNNLHQHPLASHAIELPVEDLLPRAEIQLAICYSHHYLPPHHLALVVRVGVALASASVGSRSAVNSIECLTLIKHFIIISI
jgi:hypothetical protein